MVRTSGSFVVGDFAVKQVKTDGTIDSTATPATVSAIASASTTGGTVTLTFTNQKLSAGETRTYALFIANTTNDTAAQADDDSIAVSFVEDTAYATPAAKASQTGNIIWSDEAAATHTDLTADWLNGYLVDIDTTAKINAD